MFTGIIEELGSIGRIVTSSNGLAVSINASGVLEGSKRGDSIAVNGVCLTVVELSANTFTADVSEETLRRTSLRQIKPGARVNLERPLTPTTRLGGHIVQGHVDAVGEFEEARSVGNGWVVRIRYPRELGRYIVEKGSITVDGISLTVAQLGSDWFDLAIIPHTWKATNLSTLKPGEMVNLEVDVIAKYVERLLGWQSEKPALTLERLAELGY